MSIHIDFYQHLLSWYTFEPFEYCTGEGVYFSQSFLFFKTMVGVRVLEKTCMLLIFFYLR